MRLRTFVAGSVAEALRQVAQDLGPDALVLETREEDGRTIVIAAEVEREEPADALMRLRAEVALLRHDMARTPGREPAAAAEPPPRSRLARLEARLQDQALAPDLVARVLRMAAAAPARDGDPLDPRTSLHCQNAVAGLLPGASGKNEANARCYAFVGPPGAGKTTTIAKLAEQTAARDDRKFGILTLDGDRPGNSEALAGAAGRLRVPFRAVRGPADLQDAMDEMARLPMILLDTAGAGTRDGAALDLLRERLQVPGRIAVHLVLPANLESRALERSARAFLKLRPVSLVFTKLDETERLGALVNLPVALGLAVSALGHGRSLQGDLAPATRMLVAEVLLGRRGTDLRRTTAEPAGVTDSIASRAGAAS